MELAVTTDLPIKSWEETSCRESTKLAALRINCDCGRTPKATFTTFLPGVKFDVNVLRNYKYFLMRTFHRKIPNRNLDGKPDSQQQACSASPAGISPSFHWINRRIGATPAGHLVNLRMASRPGRCASESAHHKDSISAHPTETCVGCCAVLPLRGPLSLEVSSSLSLLLMVIADSFPEMTVQPVLIV